MVEFSAEYERALEYQRFLGRRPIKKRVIAGKVDNLETEPPAYYDQEQQQVQKEQALSIIRGRGRWSATEQRYVDFKDWELPQ